MYIDYSKIIIGNLKEMLPEERITELKMIGDNERTNLRKKYRNIMNSDDLNYIMGKGIEFAYLSRKNIDKTNIEKTIIANNITFKDNKFAEILINGSFDKESLETYLKLVNYLKLKNASKKIDVNDKKFINAVNAYTVKLVNHFNRYYGNVKPYLIINKINEILSLNPSLLETKDNKHSR